MKTVFKDKRIAGILCVLPENEIPFEDEVSQYSFPEKQTLRLKKIMGFEKHRIAKPETATSDFCVYGIKELINRGLLTKEEIGAVIVVTITPDHFVPHVSNVIQGELGLSQDVFCLDIAQGCVGFILGLIESFMLLDHMEDKKVVLCNADVLSHRVSKQDRGSYPLVGDGASITVLENAPSDSFSFEVLMDGTRRDALIIPAGGSRMPSSAATMEMEDAGDGNIRSLENLVMDGQGVFNYVQTDAPELIEKVIKDAELDKDQIDWFLFHQPNEFMLRKLAERLKVPYEKVPMNVVSQFGNPSGASIPYAIASNLADELTSSSKLCCLSGFGGGLCCGVAIANIGNFDFCDMVVSDL